MTTTSPSRIAVAVAVAVVVVLASVSHATAAAASTEGDDLAAVDDNAVGRAEVPAAPEAQPRGEGDVDRQGQPTATTTSTTTTDEATQATAAAAAATAERDDEEDDKNRPKLKRMKALRMDVHGHSVDDPAHKHHTPGHASALFAFLLVCMMVAQAALVYWKKHYGRSFQQTTLVLLWLIPMTIGFIAGHWRFLATWLGFSAWTSWLISLSSKRQLDATTPRVVYSWFYNLYRASNFCAVVGYLLTLSAFFGVAGRWTSNASQAGVLMMFYGLYYGVLCRDCAEVCADRLAANMGYHTKDRELGANVCAVCDGQLVSSVRIESDNGSEEPVHALECGHQFHDLCIRGWALVGKKATCPRCREKVDLKGIFKSPWQRESVAWSQLLDAIRYLIVWNPIILFVVQYAFVWLDHKWH